VRSPARSLVAGVLLLIGLLVVVRVGTETGPASDSRGGTPVDRVTDPAAFGESPTPEELGENSGPTIQAAEICPVSAYLCHGFRERGVSRVMRWANDIGEIEIRVPRPDYLDGATAREFQAAAARGILAWQNAPFPLRVSRSDRPGSEDFAVSWSQSVTGGELGRTATQWERREGISTMRVVEMVLTTHDSGANPRPLDADMVALTAAHEMGHALGLPHSDEERDLMYPTNTAPRMSTRDYRAMEALYALENGAEMIGEAR
jgi:hypothetical protein